MIGLLHLLPMLCNCGNCGRRDPPRTCATGFFNEDDGEPRRERLNRLRTLLALATASEAELDILLRWADGELTYCALASLWACDRRTARSRIEKELARALR